MQSLRDWADTLAGAARIAVQEGHFRADLDGEQFAHDCGGIALAFVHASRLMRDPKARARAETAFEALLHASRAWPGEAQPQASRAKSKPGEAQPQASRAKSKMAEPITTSTRRCR